MLNRFLFGAVCYIVLFSSCSGVALQVALLRQLFTTPRQPFGCWYFVLHPQH